MPNAPTSVSESLRLMGLRAPWKCSTVREVSSRLTVETKASMKPEGMRLMTSLGVQEKPAKGGRVRCSEPTSG